MKTLFLGGTAGNNHWRKGFKDSLITFGIAPEALLDFQVEDWNEEVRKEEDLAKEKADYVLYYIANPNQRGKMLSHYSIVEAVMALYDRGDTTVLIFDTNDMKNDQLKIIKKIGTELRKRFPDAAIFNTLDEALDWLKPKLVLSL